MRIFLALAVGSVLAGAATDATAQDLTQKGAACDTTSGYSLDARIAACTAAIQSGSVTGTGLAIAHLNRAVEYASKQDYDRALADLGESIRINPSDVAFSDRGLIHHRRKEYDLALADYAEAIRLNPNNATAIYSRGNTYGVLKNFDRAIADYNQAIRLKPDYANAIFHRGAAYSLKGDYDRAIADFNAYIVLQPRDPDVFHDRGDVYFYERKYQDAIADYTESLRLKPRQTDVLFSRGLSLQKSNRTAEAIDDFDRVIEAEPGNVLALEHHAELSMDRNDYVRAIADLSRAIDLHPSNSAYVLRLRGESYMAKKDHEHALADYNEAIRLAPKFVEVLTDRCWVLAFEMNRDLDLAKSDCDAAFAADPHNLGALEISGTLALKQQRYQDAWRYFDAAYRDPRDSDMQKYDFLYGRGLAAVHLGRTSEGESDMAKAKELSPSIDGHYTMYGLTP
jgi:tetratricopeptide (TPR) repeat protein